jgi:hypothetical protein
MPRLTPHNLYLFSLIAVVGAVGGAITFVVSYELVERMDR